MNRFTKNKRNYIMKRLGAAALVGCMTALPVFGVYAAPEDIVNTNARASLTIHKYDITAAEEDGIDITTAGFANNGKEDLVAEQKMADYAIKDVEFSYSRVGNINTYSEGGKIIVYYDIPQKLATALNLQAKDGSTDGLTGFQYTSDELNHALADLLADNTNGKNVLEKAISELSPLDTLNKTDDNGVASVDGLSVGLYFVVETKVPANVQCTVDPFFVSLPMTDNEGEAWFYDVDVYPKNQTSIPDLDKLVRQHDDAERLPYEDTATTSTGEQVDFIHVSKLPKITSSATYLTKYDLMDKMDKGLTYNKDTAIYWYDNEADARANNTEKAVVTWAAGSPNFQAIYGTPETPTYQMEVKITEQGLKEINPNLAEHWMVVSYSATANENNTMNLGDLGNKNDVILTWKRTNMDNYDTLEDRARVYSYALNIKKNFASNPTKPGNPNDVRFSLQNKTDGHYLTAVAGQAAGTYYISDADKLTSEPVMKDINASGTQLTNKQYAAAGVFVPAPDGKLVINGLEADEYILTELETSDGYSLLKEPMVINIKCTEDEITPSRTTLYDIKDKTANEAAGTNHFIDTEGERASATVDGKATNMSQHNTEQGVVSTNARVDMTILNSRTFQLPQTGGIGTFLYTMGGGAIATCGVILLATSKKKKKAE